MLKKIRASAYASQSSLSSSSTAKAVKTCNSSLSPLELLCAYKSPLASACVCSQTDQGKRFLVHIQEAAGSLLSKHRLNELAKEHRLLCIEHARQFSNDYVRRMMNWIKFSSRKEPPVAVKLDELGLPILDSDLIPSADSSLHTIACAQIEGGHALLQLCKTEPDIAESIEQEMRACAEQMEQIQDTFTRYTADYLKEHKLLVPDEDTGSFPKQNMLQIHAYGYQHMVALDAPPPPLKKHKKEQHVKKKKKEETRKRQKKLLVN